MVHLYLSLYFFGKVSLDKLEETITADYKITSLPLDLLKIFQRTSRVSRWNTEVNEFDIVSIMMLDKTRTSCV